MLAMTLHSLSYRLIRSVRSLPPGILSTHASHIPYPWTQVHPSLSFKISRLIMPESDSFSIPLSDHDVPT